MKPLIPQAFLAAARGPLQIAVLAYVGAGGLASCEEYNDTKGHGGGSSKVILHVVLLLPASRPTNYDGFLRSGQTTQQANR